MRFVLHGYGKMGHAVERVALERGHEIALVIHGRAPVAELPDGVDAIIDFSTPDAVERVVDLACASQVGLVIGTTGWADRAADFAARIDRASIGAIYAANFSPGANIVFALARKAGALFRAFPEYATGIEERHHSQKKDAPSGTALRIASEVDDASDGALNPAIVSTRAGSEFGLHTLFFDSPDDLIEISHRARGRDGFARGAVIAAERIRSVKGLVPFDDLIDALS